MADGTMMTGEGDTNPDQGNQGQASPTTDPSPAPTEGQPTQGQESGETAAEPQEGQQQGAQEGESKEADGKEEESKAPEAYEWKAPEGFEGELDQQAIEAFEPIAKELGLSQEQADKMVAMHAESIQRAEQQARDNWAQQMKTWQEDLRADPEFGGAKFDENVTSAMKAVERFGTPGLKEALEQTGMGNHPELVRTFAAIGKAVSEDKVLLGGQSQGERSAVDILYPQSKP